MNNNPEDLSSNNQDLYDNSSPESNQNDYDNENMDSFPLGKLQEVEEQLSRLVSKGVPDTSFMRNPQSCVLIWERANKQFPEPKNDDFGVDARLKVVVRAMGEGSVLTLSELVSALKTCIQQFCKFDFNLDEKLNKYVPIFLNRRNLGDSYMNLGGVVRSECRRRECMWVWESPNTEVFPKELVEKVKSFREARNQLSKRYRALAKLKNSIITEDMAGQQAALETLNSLDRKVLQVKERKEKLDFKRRIFDKGKHEKLKVPKTNSNMLLTWLKPQKTEKTVEKASVTKDLKEVAKEVVENPYKVLMECSDEQRVELERILSNLRNPNDPNYTNYLSRSYSLSDASKSLSVDHSSHTSGSKEFKDEEAEKKVDDNENDEEENFDFVKKPRFFSGKVGGQVVKENNVDLDEMDVDHSSHTSAGKDNQEDEETVSKDNLNKDNLEVVSKEFKDEEAEKKVDENENDEEEKVDDSLKEQENRDNKVQGKEKEKEKVEQNLDEFDIFELSNRHRDVWTRFFSYLSMNRQFYVNTGDNVILVEEPLDNVEASNHNSVSLKPTRHCRVFTMFDNGWKRPPMRYLVGRSSPLVTSFNQVTVDTNVDYYADSDEDWFERYDADDVEVSEEEEEEEDEEEQEWIVQDTPGVREFSTGVFADPNAELKNDLSSWVKVFCLYRNWHWIIDGKPLDYELSNKELASQNGINLAHSEYGFGFEGYTKNPIIDVMSKIRGDKIRLSRKDVESLLKLCHGKHTRKEELISLFKEERPLASTSEIRNKFTKYLTREKIDDRRHRWMVTPEAAKLFNIRKELDRILTDQLNEEILSEPVI